MAHVYIDTNVFLDFYQSATDRLEVFRALSARASAIVLPEQTRREFRRNRVARLSALAANAERSMQFQLFTTAAIRALPEFQAWQGQRDAAKAAAASVVGTIRRWMSNEQSDIVLQEFAKIEAAALHLASQDAAISKAQRRKLLGEPPTSPDKHTIGDELIWETLLDGCPGNVIIVSRDKTFLDNQALLKDEFQQGGQRKLLLVTERLRDALEALDAASPVIAKAESAMEEARSDSVDEIALTTGRCPKCTTDMDEEGYEGSDGDEAWWLTCPSCGHMVFGK